MTPAETADANSVVADMLRQYDIDRHGKLAALLRKAVGGKRPTDADREGPAMAKTLDALLAAHAQGRPDRVKDLLTAVGGLLVTPAETPPLWGLYERPCEATGCGALAPWRVFVQRNGVTAFSLACCPRHARRAVMDGHRCPDVAIHPSYRARGAVDLRDVLRLDAADAEISMATWCRVHDVAEGFELPDGLFVDADGVVRYAADAE